MKSKLKGLSSWEEILNCVATALDRDEVIRVIEGFSVEIPAAQRRCANRKTLLELANNKLSGFTPAATV